MRTVEKGWGREVIFADTDDYCGKVMIFDKAGSKGSMHFHIKKDETWFVAKGSFIVRKLNTVDAKITESKLVTGDVWHNSPGQPHQLEALEDESVIYEVSTKDEASDSYRIMPGDSQA